jgi:hypothetical protein
VIVISNLTERNVIVTQLRILATAALGALMAASACSSENIPSDEAAGRSEDTTSTFPAPEDIADPEEAAIAAYTRYWDTILASFAAPDGDFADLEAIASGQALEYAIAIEQRGLDEHVYGTGEMTHSPAIKDALLEGEVQQVVVVDCADTTGTQVLNAEGEPVAGEEYGAKEIQARAELLDGYWVITEIAVQEIGSCVPDP